MGKSTPPLLRSSTWRYAAKTGALPPKLAPLYQSPEELVRGINEEYGRLLHDNKPIEYIYKNEYARHMLSTYWDSFSIQFEYPVGGSWADIITVAEDTGISVVEIKTERDTPARLGTQVSDYRCLTPHVSLLVSNNDTEKYAWYMRGTRRTSTNFLRTRRHPNTSTHPRTRKPHAHKPQHNNQLPTR